MKSRRVSPLVGLALLGSGSLGLVAGPMTASAGAETPVPITTSVSGPGVTGPSFGAADSCNLSQPFCLIINYIEHLECFSGIYNGCV